MKVPHLKMEYGMRGTQYFLGGVGAALVLLMQPVAAQDVDFKGKTVTVIIPSAPGGGTDSIGRMIGRFLHDYLPGKPAVIFSNIPGSAGIKALNYFISQ